MCLLALPSLLVLAALPAASPAESAATWAMVAQPLQRPPGFPKPSAVCFSSRWKHPTNAADPYDTFQAAAAFHATGFYWCNGPNAAYFSDIVRRGYAVQGWLSTILPDTLFGNTRQQGRILDQQGELVTGPWMRAFKGWWGCVNSVEYRRTYLDHIKAYLDAGVESLQMDDPGQNATAVAWGGCWCPACREKAARLGQQPPDIQAASTYEFYRDMRRAMDEHAGRHVPFSCNAHPGEPRFYDDIFDYGLQELNEGDARPGRLHAAVRAAEEHGKAVMFTYVSRDLRRTRATIALAYACGTQIIVPWDVYVGTGVPRQFGTPEEYADLYGFARGAAAYLDGYTEAAMLRPADGPILDTAAPVTVSGASPDLCLFVRARPGEPDAPVVVHAVESGLEALPFQLRLNPDRLFGNRPIRVELLEPAPYDAAAHAAAEQTKDFGGLVRRSTLATGFHHTVDVPALRPWGLVVITPEPGAGVWPPYIAPTQASLSAATLRVTLSSPAPDASLHYTVDGSAPTTASPRYETPLELPAEATVRAVAVSKAGSSEASAVRFRRLAGPAAELAPETVAGLRLWVRAADLLERLRPGAEVANWPARSGPALISDGIALFDRRLATPPILAEDVIGGQPAVRFVRPTDLLRIPGFANQHLTRGFTVFMVCRSEDPTFGITGNGANGAGGIPRLYLTRGGLTYNASSAQIGADDAHGSLLSYSHDGAETVEVAQDGRTIARVSGPQFANAGAYGSGGNLAVPFWIGNLPRQGDLAELLAYDRELTPAEREGVSRHLMTYYRLGAEPVWD